MADITELLGYTGKIGREDVQFGKGDETFSVPTSTGGNVTLTKVPSPDSDTYSILKGFHFPKNGSVTDHGAASGADYSAGNIRSVIDAIGSDEAEIILSPGEYPLITDLSIPANIKLMMPQGAVFTGSATLSIASDISSGRYRIFNGPTVAITNAEPVKPEWWGDITSAATMAAALACKANVLMGEGTYKLNGVTVTDDELVLVGAGVNKTYLDLDGTTGEIGLTLVDNSPREKNSVLAGFTFINSNASVASPAGTAFDFQAPNLNLRDIRIETTLEDIKFTDHTYFIQCKRVNFGKHLYVTSTDGVNLNTFIECVMAYKVTFTEVNNTTFINCDFTTVMSGVSANYPKTFTKPSNLNFMGCYGEFTGTGSAWSVFKIERGTLDAAFPGAVNFFGGFIKNTGDWDPIILIDDLRCCAYGMHISLSLKDLFDTDNDGHVSLFGMAPATTSGLIASGASADFYSESEIRLPYLTSDPTGNDEDGTLLRKNFIRISDTVNGVDVPTLELNKNAAVGYAKHIALMDQGTDFAYWGVNGSAHTRVTSLKDMRFYIDYGEVTQDGLNFENSTPSLATLSDNTVNLGSASKRWKEVFAGNGSINTSDEREKQDISELTAAEKSVAADLKKLIKTFRFKDAVAEKGDAARIHCGVVAQDVVAAFSSQGLDAYHYGILCWNEWDEVVEDGVVVTPAGDRFGIRYDELLSFIIAAI